MSGLAGRRLVFVLPWAELAGAETQALAFAEHLLEAGASVDVCALTDADGPAIDAFRRAGVPWTVSRMDWYGSRSAKVRELSRLVRTLRSLRPDALLPYCTPANVYCGLVWRWTGAGTCLWHQQDVLGSRLGERLLRVALRRTPAILSNSAHGISFLERWGAPRDRVRVVPPFARIPQTRDGRDPWRTRLGLGERTVACMLGTLGPNKDHRTLLRAWSSAGKRLGDAVLVLAGRSVREGEDAAKALAYDLELGRSVRFLGYVEDVGGLLEASDLAVLSTRSEGLPNAVLEPMAKGLLLVASDVPGTREAVGRDGVALLVPPGDHHALADAIVSGVGDDALHQRAKVCNPRSVAARFGPESLERHAAEVAGALGRGRGKARP